MTSSRSTKGCSPPGPSGATPTSRSPTRRCATSSSRPRGRPAARTASPSASSSSPTGPVAEEAKRLIGEGARRFWAAKREADGYDRGSGAEADSPKARMARTMQHYVDTYESVPVLSWPASCRYRATRPQTDGASIYPACQNLLLAARALGYGGVMTGWQFARGRAAGTAAHPRRGRDHGHHHPRPAAGAARPGAPAAAARAGVRRAAGGSHPPGRSTRPGCAHTSAGPPTRQPIESGCCARQLAEG